ATSQQLSNEDPSTPLPESLKLTVTSLTPSTTSHRVTMALAPDKKLGMPVVES
ncbi:hypothetical protein AVEN_106915-1, partial [Araneus ventricosus]